MAGPSEPLAFLRVGTDAETADAVTRSHLSDGLVVGWYGEDGVVIDAEVTLAEPPPTLAGRYGAWEFWARWTAAECRAKLADIPIVLWLREHGLEPPPPPPGEGARVEVVTLALDDLTVSVGRVAIAHRRQAFPRARGSCRSGAGR